MHCPTGLYRPHRYRKSFTIRRDFFAVTLLTVVHSVVCKQKEVINLGFCAKDRGSITVTRVGFRATSVVEGGVRPADRGQ